MNPSLALYVLGWLWCLGALALAIPLLAALAFGESLAPFALTQGVALGVGLLLVYGVRVENWTVRARDGYLIVVAGWVSVSVFGALPYLFSGVAGPADALFESVSGFTTTGSTVLSGLDAQPRSLMLWRSLSQWLGGMGIILFTIALLPLLGIGGMQLFKAEVPGPVTDKIRPRIVETARRLWLIYVGLTSAEFVVLVVADVEPFDALCHALTTLATGGFSTHDASVAAFGSPLVEWIIVFFMLLAGMNFFLHYRVLNGQFGALREDGELKYFLVAVAGSTAIVTLTLLGGDYGIEEAVRLAAFQVVAVLTTTGYASADFELWPPLTHALLLMLMVLGGMSGSTSGGVKSLRALIGFRAFRASFARLLHPRAVRTVKYGNRVVPEEVLSGVWAFFIAYLLIAIVSTLLIAACGYDLDTALSASLTAIGNVGPGLSEVGATDTFAHFPVLVKASLMFCMLAGRLEVFTLLVILSPGFWRR